MSEAEAAFRYYSERKFGPGTFNPGADHLEGDDNILRACLESSHDYMRQSEGCKNSYGGEFFSYAGIVESTRINAFATRENGVNLCGVHFGLYSVASELGFFVMSRGATFTEIGDPEKETSKLGNTESPPAFWLFDQILAHGKVIDKSAADHIVPQCPHRYMYANYLILLIMRFVWFHELFHCLNGHVGSLKAINPDIALNEAPSLEESFNLAEADSNALPLSTKDFMNAIELDADRSALFAMFETQRVNKENVVGIANLGMFQRLKMNLFAAYLATYLLEELSRRSDEKEPHTHPTAYARLHNMIRTTATHLAVDDILAQRVFLAALNEFRALQPSMPDLFDPDKILSDCQDVQFQSILDRLDANVETAREYFSKWGYKKE